MTTATDTSKQRELVSQISKATQQVYLASLELHQMGFEDESQTLDEVILILDRVGSGLLPD